MSHISRLALEIELRVIERPSAAFVCPEHAVEAARILVGASPRHARRFALAMHKRVACGLDTDLIEHWARVVTKVGGMVADRRAAGG